MIILVEDNKDQRTALRVLLESEGYSVREASTSREALQLELDHPARVLITDIFMPDVDGFELIQRFRRDFPQTKVVVISGGGKVARQDYLESAKLMGVDATFPKPYPIEELIQTVAALAGPATI